MPHAKVIAGVAMVLGAGAGLLRAGPLDPARVPADTTWVMHADLERAATTPLGQWGLEEIRKDLAGEPVFAELGLSLGADLKDITLFGWDGEEEGEVVLASMTGAADRVLAYISGRESYERLEHEIGVIHSWTDEADGERVQLFAADVAVGGDRLIYAGQSMDALLRAVRVLKDEGVKSRADAPDARLPVDAADGAFLFFAATEASPLRENGATSQIAKLADVVTFSAGQQEADGFAHLSVSARTEEEARNISSVLMGLKAIALMAIDPNDADLAWLRDLASAIQFESSGLNVVVTCRYDAETIIRAVEAYEAEEAERASHVPGDEAPDSADKEQTGG